MIIPAHFFYKKHDFSFWKAHVYLYFFLVLLVKLLRYFHIEMYTQCSMYFYFERLFASTMLGDFRKKKKNNAR